MKRVRQTPITYAVSVSTFPEPAHVPPSVSPPILDVESLHADICQKIKDDIGPLINITALELQVHQTSMEISSIRASFEDQLAGVTQSVNTLTAQANHQ